MYDFFQCMVCQRYQNGRLLGYFEQTVDCVNMPVNDVVVKGISPHFFVAVVVRAQHNDVPPRGGAGVRRLIFTIVGEFF
jgi:hypothetical protein